jgi:F-type H+-transporting ATPase subunit delta
MAGLVAKRYGTAIFELAKEKDAVEALETEIILLEEAFKKMELEEFLGHPKIPQAEKIKVLEESLTDKISHDLLGLLVLIVQKGRYLDIDDILQEVLEQIDVHHGRVKAYISSADALTHDQKDKIVHQLAKQAHKEIIPIYEIDESLIGGLVIRIGDRIVDNSIKGHLHTLSRDLLATKIEL